MSSIPSRIIETKITNINGVIADKGFKGDIAGVDYNYVK